MRKKSPFTSPLPKYIRLAFAINIFAIYLYLVLCDVILNTNYYFHIFISLHEIIFYFIFVNKKIKYRLYGALTKIYLTRICYKYICYLYILVPFCPITDVILNANYYVHILISLREIICFSIFVHVLTCIYILYKKDACPEKKNLSIALLKFYENN